MNDLKKNNEEMSLPQKIISEHEPQVGDVYKSNSMSYDIFVRIKKIEKQKLESGVYYTRLYLEEYDMFSRDWHESRWGEDHYVGLDSLKDSYSYVIFDFDEMLQQFDELESGKVNFGDVAPIESTALVAKGKTDLMVMKEQQEMTIARVRYMKDMMEAKAKDYTRAMERKMQPLKNAIAVMNKTVENMKYAIQVIEGYLGVGVDAITVSDGDRAAMGTPVVVRQRILFMDEEVACIKADGQGLDHYGKEVFYEWMKDPKKQGHHRARGTPRGYGGQDNGPRQEHGGDDDHCKVAEPKNKKGIAMSMRIIEITESKKEKMAGLVEDMLNIGGELMHCVNSLGEGGEDIDERRNYRDGMMMRDGGRYGDRYRYGNRYDESEYVRERRRY